MKKITLNSTQGDYDIIIENNLIDKLDEYIYNVYKNKNIFILTDKNVETLYMERIISVLLRKYDVKTYVINDGEESKSFDVYMNTCKYFLNNGIKREHLILSIGGGVVGDIAGFVSSTLYRGLPFINIPTTLLSQLDSSIGGKTGINFLSLKNVIGSFKQPKLVLIDPTFLKTLSEIEFMSGVAELIKHAVIGDKKLFSLLEKDADISEEIICKSLLIKKELVEKDEFDLNERMKLNFGHTFGHVLEMKYQLKHGIAVAFGMLMALELGIKLNISDINTYKRVENLLMKYKLTNTKYNYEEYLEEIINDKKNLAGIINFILVPKIGEAIIKKVPEENLKLVISGECIN